MIDAHSRCNFNYYDSSVVPDTLLNLNIQYSGQSFRPSCFESAPLEESPVSMVSCHVTRRGHNSEATTRISSAWFHTPWP